jgi:hypothetical protein
MSVAYAGYTKGDSSRRTIANYTGTEAVTNSSIVNEVESSFPMIELHVSARNLKDMDIITVSDPFCILFLWDQGRWNEFARTEVIWNNLNPEWVTFFRILYIFEIRQPLLFRVYDCDKATAQLDERHLIGEVEIDLARLISSAVTTELPLTIAKNRQISRGILLIAPEQAAKSNNLVEIEIRGIELKRLRFFAKNDPFFVIAKASEGARFLPVYQSEVKSDLRWKPFKIPYQVLCNCDPDRPLRISFFDCRSHVAAALIGYHDTTFARLSEALGRPLIVQDAKAGQIGRFSLSKFNLIQKFGFCDFLRRGLQLNLIVAVDFTASNRHPADRTSLHYLAPGGDSLNPYEQCIRAVGEILCPYDSDQLFPVLGFGAKVGGAIQHCFPLTLSPNAPCVKGLGGILGAYQHALRQVELSGPTLFSHVIRYASQLAVTSFQQSRTYTILLIVTDGVINDMQDTTDSIVDAGRIPLSIIIVGVGNADFAAMDVLDADEVPLVSRRGEKMCRDLVQFVPFNKFARQHYSVLAAEVLDEVPRQLCEWAEMNGVRP